MPKTAHSVVLLPPAIETLLARSEDSPWPSPILSDPNLCAHAERRERLLSRLQYCFSHLPDPTTEFARAIETGDLDASAAADLYRLLGDFLEVEPQHARIILYLPFELIAPRGGTMRMTVREPFERFMRAYMHAWERLLEESDVRANFVDGNILEPDLAPHGQPLVKKAAHLIPELVRRGYVSRDAMRALRDTTDDPVLSASITDALECLLLPPAPPDSKAAFERDWLSTLPEKITSGLAELEVRAARDYAHGLPPARIAWERLNNENLLASAYAEDLARYIVGRDTEASEALALAASADGCLRAALFRGIGYAAEQLAGTDIRAAKRLAKAFIMLLRAQETPSDETEEVLARWSNMRLVDADDLYGLPFVPPHLSGPFPTEGTFAKEVRGYSSAIAALQRDPRAASLLFPVAIFFGSWLKGYAKRKADLDVGVLVRPGTPFAERPRIRKMLQKLFPGEKIGGKVVEFWLEEGPEGLTIRDFPDPDVLLADPTWVHLLMSSVWLGERDALAELYAKLLAGFLHPKDATYHGRALREFWLEELEREVLQYRLMHKGYRRFFPPIGGVDARAQGLDPVSTFWDSGYRRLATTLFISRVFLPRLA